MPRPIRAVRRYLFHRAFDLCGHLLKVTFRGIVAFGQAGLPGRHGGSLLFIAVGRGLVRGSRLGGTQEAAASILLLLLR